LAVGIDRFAATVDQELDSVALGRGGFKAIRGDYGSGKTFFGRWVQERARTKGFVTSEVQISETETPLHRMETIYRRLCERFATADTPERALRHIIDSWFYTIEEDLLAEGKIRPEDAQALICRVEALMEKRLSNVTRASPAFSAALRTYRRALASGDTALAEGLIAWIGGQPNVAASIKRQAGIKGEIDHFGAANFLSGLLIIMKDCGFRGLVLVLDEERHYSG
jgi:BREX system ATP-binding protein BrxC/D